MVGDRYRRLAVGGNRPHQVFDPRRTIEHRELGVDMQMGEPLRRAASPRTTSGNELHVCKQATGN